MNSFSSTSPNIHRPAPLHAWKVKLIPVVLPSTHLPPSRGRDQQWHSTDLDFTPTPNHPGLWRIATPHRGGLLRSLGKSRLCFYFPPVMTFPSLTGTIPSLLPSWICGLQRGVNIILLWNIWFQLMPFTFYFEVKHIKISGFLLSAPSWNSQFWFSQLPSLSLAYSSHQCGDPLPSSPVSASASKNRQN